MSDRVLKIISIVLALAGLLVAGYLTNLHLSDSSALLCAEGGGCDVVRDSPYSEIAGIPVAIFGIAGYLAILVVLLLDSKKRTFLYEYGPTVVFGFSLIGVLYSIYLTYLELFVIIAICPYCVISAVLMLVIFVIAILRMTMRNRELLQEE